MEQAYSAIANMMTSYTVRLCESVGMRVAKLAQDRQFAVVLIVDGALLPVHWAVAYRALAEIEIALVGGCGEVVDVNWLQGAEHDSSQWCAATGGWN